MYILQTAVKMDLNYDELYEIKYLLKYRLKEEDDEDTKKIMINALKKVCFKLAVFEQEKELIKKEADKITKYTGFIDIDMI